MKPGKLCKKSGKRAYGSYAEAIQKGMDIFRNDATISQFGAYYCDACKCWHLTTHCR